MRRKGAKGTDGSKTRRDTSLVSSSLLLGGEYMLETDDGNVTVID